jgi:hypothetical protein
MKYLVERMATLDYSNIELVSRELKFTMPEVYASTLSAHNDYLANHRNISVAGLSANAMDAHPIITSHGDHFPTMRDTILSLEGVSQVYRTKRIADLGKWNISTTSADWPAVKKWLDNNLEPMYISIDARERKEYPHCTDFPKPTRMLFQGWSTAPSDQSGKSQLTENSASTYAQALQSRLFGDNKPPTLITPAPPAWQNTAQPTVIYTQTDEPHPNKNDDASAVSTSTTASLTTHHTSDAILIMQRQWEKEKETLDQAIKTKLDSVDERIQLALTSFHSELSTSLAAHVQEMKTKLQGMIVMQQTHVIKVALAALTSTSSPYVTNDQLYGWSRPTPVQLRTQLPYLSRSQTSQK